MLKLPVIFLFLLPLTGCNPYQVKNQTASSGETLSNKGLVAESIDTPSNGSSPEFEELNVSSDWKLKLNDPGTGNWQDHWFLDGLQAKVDNSAEGMNFSAGPINRDNAHHAVLWTKDIFKGDVKIEYEYTRTDQQLINVNILYIQANGIGEGPYVKDISQWNKLREIPAMRTYFNNMNALHISYAAFKTKNEDPEDDYIRIRKYPATETIPFKNTEIPPAYFNTGLFLPGVAYKITVIKTDDMLFFQVAGEDEKMLYSWPLTDTENIQEGRIGLRHMYTRSARYSNFKISIQPYLDE